MTDDHLHDALVGLEDSLVAVDSAHHALGYILDDLPRHGTDDVVACIMRALGTAAKEGQESLEIIRKARMAPKE